MALMTPIAAPDYLPESTQAWKIAYDEREGYPQIIEDGPWREEPDKMQWVDEVTGLDCLIVRNHFGALCGYVGVPKGHPAYGREYDELDVSVHGGLTYGRTCMQVEGYPEDEPTPWICHVPLPGRPHDVFWFGFDCGHAFDYQPAMEERIRDIMPRHLWAKALGVDDRGLGERLRDGMVYRDVAYVVKEIHLLAAQLKAMAT